MTNINDLPVEVLGYIFDLAAKDERSNPSRFRHGSYLRFWGGRFHHTCAPFVFLSVCGHWRAVAEAMPVLWTPLDATMRTVRTGTSMPAEALEHWISLSKSAPLDFFLQSYNVNDDINKEAEVAHASAMLRVLANEAHRWRSVAFDISTHFAVVLVDLLLTYFHPESLPNLKRLEVVAFDNTGYAYPVEALARAIGTITSLQELYLRMDHDNCVPALLRDIPWSQLTTVYLRMKLTVHQVASFLSQLESVVTATFDCVAGAPVNSDVRRFILPKLTTLTMNGDNNLFSLFDIFDFPALEQLNLKSFTISFYEPMQRLMERSTCCIRQITLHVIGPLQASDLAKYLGMLGLRQVQHVEFKNRDILKIAPSVVAQLKDDAPILWSWRSLRRVECVGWKAQFDYTDGPVTRITHTSKVVS